MAYISGRDSASENTVRQGKDPNVLRHVQQVPAALGPEYVQEQATI